MRILLAEIDDQPLPAPEPGAALVPALPPPRRTGGAVAAEVSGYGRYPVWRPALGVAPPARPLRSRGSLLGEINGYVMLGSSPFGAAPFGATVGTLTLDIGPTMLRVSTTHYTAPDGTPYRHGLETPSFERSLLGGSDIGGRASVSLGDVSLVDTDHYFDRLHEQVSVDGRDVVFKVPGTAGLETVFRAKGRDIVPGPNRQRLRLQDWNFLLAKPLQPTLYADTALPEIANRPLPICYGPCSFVTPTRIAQTPPTYQVNDVPSQAIGGVYVGGVPLQPADVLWRDAAGSTFALAAEPVADVTVDVEGAVVDGVYLNTTALVLRDIVSRRAGLPADQISDAHYAQLATDMPGEIQVYIPHTDQPTAADMVDRLLTPFGWSSFSWLGAHQVGVWSVPAGDPKCALTAEAGIKAIRPVDLPSAFTPPPWRVRGGYDRCFTPRKASELRGDPSDASDPVGGPERRRWLERAQDLAVAQDLTTRDVLHLAATDPAAYETFFKRKIDAELMLQAYLSLRLGNRGLFIIETDARPYYFDLGDVVYLRHPLHGLAGGRLGRVARVREAVWTELTVMV